ncbi:hypothetical protein NQ318_013397 [Aromia moschata]|uniref:Uncharacterized protein n=1 Tax=Aromia moschata TaxID=1265417 RepID=A0AAV8XYN6_9CUCU|nr:hypothetical protein NQ318_013397 [Aromia moschata]
MLLPARCEHIATNLNRTVSGDTFFTLSSLDKPFAQKWCQNFTPEQKESRMDTCADILNNIDTDPSVLAVKAKAMAILNYLTEAADFQHCFQQWKSRMERCRYRQGEYIEGEKVATVIGNE